MSEWKDKIQGNWKQIKGKMQQEYGQLTNDDLIYQKGQEDELLGRIQEKVGKSKEELKDWIDQL